MLLIMRTLPFSLIGGVWLLWLPGYNLSVAGVVELITQAGVIMLLCLNHALEAPSARTAGRCFAYARR